MIIQLSNPVNGTDRGIQFILFCPLKGESRDQEIAPTEKLNNLLELRIYIVKKTQV